MLPLAIRQVLPVCSRRASAKTICPSSSSRGWATPAAGFAVTHIATIYLLAASASAAPPNTQPPLPSTSLANAPPERIVYTTDRPQRRELLVVTTSAAETSTVRVELGDLVPSDPTFSPDGRWLVFAAELAGNQDLYAVPTNRLEDAMDALVRLTQSPSLDGAPAISRDGRLAHTSTRTGRCEVWVRPFQPEAPRIAADWARNLTPQSGSDFRPAWHPDGRWLAYSTNRDADREALTRVVLLDLSTGEHTPVPHQGGVDGSPRFSADGTHLFLHRLAVDDGGTVAADEPTIWSLPVGSSSGGAPVFGEASRVSAEERHELVPVPLADGSVARLVRHQRRWAADLRTAALTDQEDLGDLGTASVLSLAADLSGALGEGIQRFALAVTHAAWELDPTNPQYTDETILLHHRHAATTQLADRRLTTLPASAIFPSLDGADHVVAGNVLGDLVRIPWASDTASQHLTPQRGELPAAPGTLGVFGHSADPNSAAVVAAVGMSFAPPQAPADIVWIEPDGSLRNLTEGIAANDGLPRFSVDGQRIVFRSGRSGNQDLYLMQRDGSNVRRLTEHDAIDTAPALSPDGMWVAFTSTRDGNYEIYQQRLNAEGLPEGEPQRLTTHPGIDMHPDYSPDGMWLVFASDRGGLPDEMVRLQMRFSPQPGGELWALRLADGLLVRLTDNQWEDGLATWTGPQQQAVGSSTRPTSAP